MHSRLKKADVSVKWSINISLMRSSTFPVHEVVSASAALKKGIHETNSRFPLSRRRRNCNIVVAVWETSSLSQGVTGGRQFAPVGFQQPVAIAKSPPCTTSWINETICSVIIAAWSSAEIRGSWEEQSSAFRGELIFTATLRASRSAVALCVVIERPFYPTSSAGKHSLCLVICLISMQLLRKSRGLRVGARARRIRCCVARAGFDSGTRRRPVCGPQPILGRSASNSAMRRETRKEGMTYFGGRCDRRSVANFVRLHFSLASRRVEYHHHSRTVVRIRRIWTEAHSSVKLVHLTSFGIDL